MVDLSATRGYPRLECRLGNALEHGVPLPLFGSVKCDGTFQAGLLNSYKIPEATVRFRSAAVILICWCFVGCKLQARRLDEKSQVPETFDSFRCLAPGLSYGASSQKVVSPAIATCRHVRDETANWKTPGEQQPRLGLRQVYAFSPELDLVFRLCWLLSSPR